MKKINKVHIISIILLLLLFCGYANAAIPQWGKFRHDMQNTGKANYFSSTNGTVKWTFPTGLWVDSSAAIDSNGIIYFTSYDGNLYAVYPNGTKKWQFNIGAWIFSSPAIDPSSNIIYFGSDNYRVYAIYPNGTEKWNHTIGNKVISSPAIDENGIVYAGNNNGAIYALYPNTTEKWHFDTGDKIQSSAAIDQNGTIYFESMDGFVYALYPDGTLKWTFPVGCCGFASPAIDQTGIIYIGGYVDHKMHALYPNGTEKWNYTTGNIVASSAAIDSSGNIYFGNDDGILYALYPNGTEKWITITGQSAIDSSPSLDQNNNIYVGSNNGNISCFDANGDLKWSYHIGGITWSSPAIGKDGTVYVGGDNNIFYAFQSASFDPSGFIKDINGNSIYNAWVKLSNNTWIDPNQVYSDLNGHWATNIYSDGIYNYNVTKQGFAATTGSQYFVMGGVNYNFTLDNTRARVYGTIFEYKTMNGSKTLRGNINQITQGIDEAKGRTISTGSTLYYKYGYSLRLISIDSINKEAVVTIYKDGIDVSGFVVIKDKEPYFFKIDESLWSKTYLMITAFDFFSGTEVHTAKFTIQEKKEKKFGALVFDFLKYLNDITLIGKILGINGLMNWMQFSDQNQNPVEFDINTTTIVSQDFDFNSDAGDYQSIYVTLDAESKGADASKVGISYTDDDIDFNDYFDDYYINQRMMYRTSYQDFKSIDTNGNKKIRVWFKYYSGYSGLFLRDFSVTAFGSGFTNMFLPDATILYNSTINTKSSTPDAFYEIFVPLTSVSLKYYKLGYETKIYNFTLNSTNNNVLQNVYLNRTNVTENITAEYIRVEPDPSYTTQAKNAMYKTLDKTSAIGGYQIKVCPFLQPDNCLDSFDVKANEEDTRSLPMYPIGEYSIFLTGYKDGFLDLFRDIIVQNNFTVISSTPTVNWLSATYYLGETMILEIYNPAGTNKVTVYYPNNTILFQNIYSPSTDFYNFTIQTDLNSTPGTYRAAITEGNIALTELKAISKEDYWLKAPQSINWGEILNIDYQSPRTSSLIMIDSAQNVKLSKDVEGQNTLKYNTSLLEKKDDILNIKLIKQGILKAQTNVTIKYRKQNIPEESTNDILNLFGANWFWAFVITAGMMIVVGTKTQKTDGLNALPIGITGLLGAGIFTLMGWLPYWLLFSIILLIIIIFGWQQSDKTKTGGG